MYRIVIPSKMYLTHATTRTPRGHDQKFQIPFSGIYSHTSLQQSESESESESESSESEEEERKKYLPYCAKSTLLCFLIMLMTSTNSWSK